MNMNVHNREVKERSKTKYSPKKKKKKSFINYAKNVYGKLCEIFVNYYD